ncbi:MAG: iron complex transport system substrate-binding protein [archaeon GW2011_AR3]|nr:MAG: iron complex transport system substrate-binding protein [archaeon GW2011_AR3]MBS3109638.1 cobalamin-binding protein [Candidatus Woesearchaeota archaeon]
MKIVSLAPSNTEILFALGMGKYIEAVTRFCDYPDDAKFKKKVGGWLDIRTEIVEKARPDLVFTSNYLQSEIVERLHKAKLKVIHVDPRSLDEVYESILTIGDAVGKSERAAGLVDEMKRRLNSIAEKSRKRQKLRVYCEEWHKPPTVSGNWVPELLEISGAVSYCAKGKKSYEVEVDQIAKFNPHLAIISWCGFGRRMDLKKVAMRPLWNKIPAFKNNRIFAIDDSFLNRPGPRLVEGARQISAILDKISSSHNNA